MWNAMNEFKQSACAHMRRDLEGGGKWVCNCEACNEIRSLVGMEKMIGIRPLVREIEKTEDRLRALPDGPQKFSLRDRYLRSSTNWPTNWPKKPVPGTDQRINHEG
jgi:hypothetical protein